MKKKLSILIICISFLPCLFLFGGCNPIKYKLEFIVDNEVYRTIDTAGKETITLPTNPTKDDFIFDGWFWDNNEWQRPFTANSLLNEPLSNDMKVYAKWINDNSPKNTQANFLGFTKENEDTYSISLSNNTEVLNMSNVVEIDSRSTWKLTTDIQANNSIASKMATLNVGDNTYYVLVTAQNEDVKLYTIKIRRKPIYTVSFNGYSDTQYIEEGSCATQPSEPQRTGYTFNGWDFDFSLSITSNQSIYPIWNAKKYSITFYSNFKSDKENSYQVKDILFGNHIKFDNNIFSDEGYYISKWNTKSDGTGQSFSNFDNYYHRIDDNVDFYAQWDLINYDIKYYIDGTLLTLKNNQYEYSVSGEGKIYIDKDLIGPNVFNINSDDIQIGIPNIEKNGYKFNNWKTLDGVKVNCIKNGTHENISLYSEWSLINYSINYETYNIKLSVDNPFVYNIESSKIKLNTSSYNGYDTTWVNNENEEITEIETGSFGNINLYIAFKDKNGLLFYAINNFEKLKNLKPNCNYLITNNIDCDGESIANFLIDTNTTFSGIFDGNDCIVSNLNVNFVQINTDNINLGLFNKNNGVIKNLIINNINSNLKFSNSNVKNLTIGCLVGLNNGIVENCSIFGSFNVNVNVPTCNVTIGGIVGNNNNIINNVCSSIVLTTSSNYYSNGKLLYMQGGICGKNSNVAIISNCSNQQVISATINERATQISHIGGICSQNSGQVESCYNVGNIESKILTSYPGDEYTIASGIVANNNGLIKNCYSNASVTSFTNCERVTTIASGISGISSSNGIVKNSYAIGQIVSQGKYGEYCICGGINGKGGKIENCFSLCDINITSSNAQFGALYGIVVETNIINCYISNSQKYYDISNQCNLNSITETAVNIVSYDSFTKENFILNDLCFGKFLSKEDVILNDNNVWIIIDGYLPRLFWENN